MTLSDRLKRLRKYLNLTQSEFASKVGVATSTYQHYERGEREATEKFLINIITTFGLNSSWLMTGTGSMLGNVASEKITFDNIGEAIRVSISTLMACCGNGVTTYPTEFLDEKIVVSTKHIGKIDPERLPYAVQTSGRSMVGYGIEEESLVIINPAEEVHTGHIVLAVIDEKSTIKKLYERGDGIDLVSSNGDKLHFTHEELSDPYYVRFMGRVMLVISPPNEGV